MRSGTNNRRILIILLVFWCTVATAQDSVPAISYTVRGYVKDLVTINLYQPGVNIPVDNLIHNRFNFKAYYKKSFKGVLEVRNRLFVGNTVKANPQLAAFVDDEWPNQLDMSATWDHHPDWVAQCRIDRLYLNWEKGKIEVTAGRQRINWGMALAWNPNDIFNAYSFFDFDYEERPGSDAIRAQYYLGQVSRIEVAARPGTKGRGSTAAGLWRTNRWGYDFQALAGISEHHVVWGGAWAGNIKTSGFKGEFSFFYPFTAADGKFTSVVTIMGDLTLKNGLYLAGGALYQSTGTAKFNNQNLLAYQVSARSLSPFRLTTMVQAMVTFHPLVSGGLSLMYAPTGHVFFFNPTVSWSMRPNLDLSLVGQTVYYNPGDQFHKGAKYLFVRVKYSF
ncbi:MAG: hypothetical protein KDD36_05990 [Flavobacteriales bacterium]|nr:hypothetical protein [Flavobacteriales bacterium]